MSKKLTQPIDDLFPDTFRWTPAARHEWIDGVDERTGKPDRFLIEAEKAGRTTSWQQPPGDLYQILADTDPTEDGVRQFADRFGVLGIPIPVGPRSRRPKQPYRFQNGETLVNWKDAIAALARVLELRNDGEGEDEDGAVRDQLLAADLTKGLREHTSIAVVRGHEKFKLTFRVQTLIGFIWAQLTRVIIGEVGYRRCEGCGKVLVLSPSEGFRSQRSTCSNACRQKFLRNRIRLAKERKAGGASPKEIAEELGTTATAVKVYLSKKG
jgi:hypothetical protein